jgi:hypothetical protein
LLARDDKEATLRSAIATANREELAAHVFHVDPSSFRQVPGSPFAYWVSEQVRSIFLQFPSFESEEMGRTTRCGLGTLDVFRFVRLRWEVVSSHIGSQWATYFHGGSSSPIYEEFPQLVQWAHDGQELKTYVEEKVGSASRKVQGQDHYYLPGMVFPRRSKVFSPKAMPAGGIYSDGGQAVFTKQNDLLFSLAIMSSKLISFICSLYHGTSGLGSGGGNPQYQVGLIGRLPWPDSDHKTKLRLEVLASRVFALKRNLVATAETSYVFHLPVLLQVPGETLTYRIAGWQARVLDSDRQLAEHQREIDDITFRLYGIEGVDRRAIEEGVATPTPSDEEMEESEDDSRAAGRN